MSVANATAVSEADLWGIDGSIVLYGVMCDVFMLVPLILYLLISDTNSYA